MSGSSIINVMICYCNEMRSKHYANIKFNLFNENCMAYINLVLTFFIFKLIRLIQNGCYWYLSLLYIKSFLTKYLFEFIYN